MNKEKNVRYLLSCLKYSEGVSSSLINETRMEFKGLTTFHLQLDQSDENSLYSQGWMFAQQEELTDVVGVSPITLVVSKFLPRGVFVFPAEYFLGLLSGAVEIHGIDILDKIKLKTKFEFDRIEFERAKASLASGKNLRLVGRTYEAKEKPSRVLTVKDVRNSIKYLSDDVEILVEVGGHIAYMKSMVFNLDEGELKFSNLKRTK